MGARLTCSCSQLECYNGDESTLRIEAEVFELSSDGRKWVKLDQRLATVRVFVNVINELTSCQPRLVATTSNGSVLVDSLVPIGEKVHKVSDYFVYVRVDATRTLGFNTLNPRDTALFLSQTSNTSAFNMFQHSFSASVCRIAVINGDSFVETREAPQPTHMSLSPLSIRFTYAGANIDVDLMEIFACPSGAENSIDVAHGNSIFRFMIPAHAHLFLIQALNISTLLLARTTTKSIAVAYLQRQNEKIEQRLNNANDPIDTVQREQLALKKVVITQRLNAIQGDRSLPGYELIQNEISPESSSLLIETAQLPSLFLYHFNMNSFRIWRKPHHGITPSTSFDAGSQPQTPVDESVTTFNGTTTFHAKNSSRVGSNEDTEYQVRKTNGRLGLTIYAHNDDDGVIRAEVRGVTSFTPRCARVGDAVIAVDGEPIASVASAADVEKLLRYGKVIHLRRQTKIVSAPPPPPKETGPPKGCEKLIMALQELLDTEKKYVVDLRETNDIFLSIRRVREIMGSSLKLYKIQSTFVDSLDEAIGDMTRRDISSAQVRDSVTRVSAVFLNKCAEFKFYAEYAAAYLRLQREIKHCKELLNRLEAINSTKEQHCSWESRMIKPVQRIVQYPLLLKAISDACGSEAARERAQVDAAMKKMQTLVEYVNEMQRLHEEHSINIESVRRANESWLVEKRVRLETRDLLIFAHVKWRDAPSDHYVVFVFQTVILLMPSYARKELKMKWTRLLPINEVDVNELSPDSLFIKLYHAAFEGPNGQLSHSNPNTVYNIECCQLQLKQQLVKSIKKARATFGREFNRPLSGSSQSDGGYVSEVSKPSKLF